MRYNLALIPFNNDSDKGYYNDRSPSFSQSSSNAIVLNMKVLNTLVHWYLIIDDSPNEDTEMWVVQPDIFDDGTHRLAVIHLNSIFHAAHLLPVYGNEFVPLYLDFTVS
jgi:hypothetical protein